MGVDGASWESAVRSFREREHFLQSPAWSKFQQVRGNEVVTRSGRGWKYRAIIEKGRLGKRLYCPYGPVCEDEAAFRAALADMYQVARARRLDFVRVEPRLDVSKEKLERLGLMFSHHNVQPADTLLNLVDAEKVTEEEILAAIKKHPRRSWRKSEKDGVTYRVSNDPQDVEIFLEMLRDVSSRTGMQPHPDSYFQDIARSLFPTGNAGIMFAELDGKPVASLIYYSDGVTMSYAHAASFTEYRKLSPGTGLVVFALLKARETGHKLFDFYGVAPEDAPEDHPWNGFTRFKSSFGGQRVSFPGTWELPVKKAKHALYHWATEFVDKRPH